MLKKATKIIQKTAPAPPKETAAATPAIFPKPIVAERAAESAYRMSIHSDRGAYRPGDKARFFAVLRTQDNVAPKAGLPVVMKV